MIIQPGSTLYGIYDETAGGWDSATAVDIPLYATEDEALLAIDGFTGYTVRPFVVPEPGEAND